MNTRSLVLALGLSLSATFAVAQTAPLSSQLATQVQQAASEGNADRISELAAQNPNSAVAIAQTAVNTAAQIASSNPAGAARLAAVATQIASQPNVIAAAPSLVAQIAASAASVVSNPTVQSAAPTAVAQVTSNANRIAANPAVQQAAPNLVTQITSTLPPSGPVGGGGSTPQIPIVDPVISNVSPSGE
jgi:hypothetical protein